ncbi:hypothetical protein GCM10011386_02620 [Parapedobacter defluvii]|uniref:Uncharacterized protein n=1 Tax=Parapedobacter defluvii TaxID=2045106 RepID=A0ABQ1KY49_9SPHI|nr:hypothetical protein [Parapedobacter defluvii]GGC14362.1 hypothetical protein GCM10011386_02620 [Parapedobacter defluvii]
MKRSNASKYFDDTPSGWGLRGDPFLWEDLKSKFQMMNAPVSVSEYDKQYIHFTTWKAPESKHRGIFVPV